MYANQMSSYSDGCTLSEKGHEMCCTKKVPLPLESLHNHTSSLSVHLSYPMYMRPRVG